MAKIRDTAVTLYAATTASMVCEMPTHVTGDLLVACVAKDSAVAFTTPAGWTLIQASTSTGAAGGVYAKRATSSSETVTFTLTIETCLATVTAIQDVNGSTVADAIPTSAIQGTEDATLPFTGIGLTTGHANSLLMHMRYQDTTIGTSHLPPWVNIFQGDVANGGMAVAYSFEPTASTAITAPTMWSAGQDDGKSVMIEIRDGSSGAVTPPYIPLDVVPSVLISPLTGTDGTVDRGAYVAAASIAITSVAGKTVSGVTVATTADSGYNPFRGSTRNAGVSSTTLLNHTEFNLTTAQDITTGDLIFGTYLNLAPRDYVDTGKAVQGGVYFIAGSSSANWRAWVVGGQFSKTEKPDARNNYLIQPSVSTTQYGSAGTPNWASLDYMAFGSSGYYGAPSILWSELWELRTAILAGGTSTNPIGFEDVINTINLGCGNIPLLQQVGALATVWIPIQFGGNETIGVLCNLNTFQFPQVADEIDYVDFHVSSDKIGIEFYGLGSGDYLHFTNCLFTSPSPYHWRFNASHSASADIDFSGSTVVGATVTLQSTSDLDSVSFIDCPTFTQNSATLTNCTFSDTKVTSATPAAAALISASSFTSSGTGYAIEISGTAADMTLTNVDFTGYAVTDGSTGNEAIYVNIGSGSMTVSISGGTTPSIRTAGATVLVQNAVTVKVTVKDATSLVAIEDARVLMEATSIATGSHTGSNDAAILTDSTKSFTADELIGYRIYNTTDGSDGLITDNDATTVTATLSGGTGNDWDTSDAYIIVAKPALNPVSITSSTTTATVTHRNHGLTTGAAVVIRGATEDEYNGIFTISNVSTNAYDYTMSADPAGSSASGSPTATAVILSDVTGDGDPNPAGVLQTTSFNYVIDQPITGKVRKATTGTKYKTGTLTGTITSAGLDTTMLLIADE
jgi:hypothetical protein